MNVLGKKLSNGTYTGAKGMFLRREIDFDARPESLIVFDNEKFITLSSVCHAESIKLGHYLGKF